MRCSCTWTWIFFFQAEDGIRDLVRSRGLGDVYKRQLRWSSSNSPFLKYSPFIDNLQIIDPFNLNGLNLLKPRGINSIIGTGIFIRLNYLNEKKIGVKFTHAGVIGPKFGRKNIKAMKEINNEQLGWLEITYLSNKLRICRGCLLYTSPSPRDRTRSRMPSSA